MSKFIDKIKRGTQTTPSPIGFRTATISNKAKILLVAVVNQAKVNNLPEYLANADACLLKIDDLETGTASLKQLNQSTGEIVWGGWFKNNTVSNNNIEQIEADYFVFDTDQTPITLPESSGCILEINSQMSDSLLRAIDDLSVDAVIVTNAPGDHITWQFLAELQRIDNLVSKPMLILAPAEIGKDALLTLWSAGVDGLLLDTSVETTEVKLKELNEYIKQTTFPLPRKKKRDNVTLPVIGRETQSNEEQEEEEE